jgi:hypothetical protein
MKLRFRTCVALSLLLLPALIACGDSGKPAESQDASSDVTPSSDATGTTDVATNLDATGGSDTQTSNLDSGIPEAEAEAGAPACGAGPAGARGSAIWAEASPASIGIDVLFLAADAQGNVFEFGQYEGTMTLAGASGTSKQLTGDTNASAFLAKYDPTGQLLWAKNFASGATTYARGVATDSGGNAYIVGSYENLLQLDGTADAGSYAHGYSQSNGYLAKFDPNGAYVWSYDVGNGSGYEILNGVTSDGQGGVVAVGAMEGNITFSAADGGVTSLTSAGSDDFLVLKLTENGGFVWARAFGDTQIQYANTVSADTAGNLYVSGFFDSTLPLGGGAGTLTDSNGVSVSDTALVRLAPDGTPVWGRALTGASSGTGETFVATTKGGVVWLAFTSVGDVDLEPSGDAGTLLMANPGGGEVGVVTFDANGNVGWGHLFGDTKDQSPAGLAVDTEGAGLVTGFFQGSISLALPDGGTTGVTSKGGADAFVMKLSASGDGEFLQDIGGATAEGGPLNQFGFAVTVGCTPVIAGTSTGDTTLSAAGDAGTFVLAGTGAVNGYLAGLVP